VNVDGLVYFGEDSADWQLRRMARFDRLFQQRALLVAPDSNEDGAGR
jgi:hypothetical protein